MVTNHGYDIICRKKGESISQVRDSIVKSLNESDVSLNEFVHMTKLRDFTIYETVTLYVMLCEELLKCKVTCLKGKQFFRL